MKVTASWWTKVGKFADTIKRSASLLGYADESIVSDLVKLSKKGSSHANWKIDAGDILSDALNKPLRLKWQWEVPPDEFNKFETARVIHKKSNIWITIWIGLDSHIMIVLENGYFDETYGDPDNIEGNKIIAKKR